MLNPAQRFNVFYGNNGQGKTNVLESIFLLASMKSFKMAKNHELIAWGHQDALLKGWVERDGINREIAIFIDNQGKKVRVDQKSVTRVTDFFGHLNVVLFTPEELNMVKGLPESRRKYLDRAVFSSDINYLSSYHVYSKILKNRNILLRNGEPAGLDIWTEKLIEQGTRIIESRIVYIQDLKQLLAGFYHQIAGNNEEVEISYRPHLIRGNVLGSDIAGGLSEALAKAAFEEQRRGTTLVGPHRDDVDFLLDGKPLKQFGSQGQQKSFVLALKMAEIEYLQRKFHSPPIFLLDDISSELDQDRKKNLMDFLKQKEMQVFITTTSLHNLSMEGIDNYRTYLVKEGKVLH